MLKIKIKKTNINSILPIKKNPLDAGIDCYANSITKTEDYIEYGLGFSLEIPEGYCGFIFPRSSVSNYDLLMCNSVGVVDSNYINEVKARFKQSGHKVYELGDRVCQLILYKYPEVEFIEVDELDDTNNRGGGHGSTGR